MSTDDAKEEETKKDPADESNTTEAKKQVAFENNNNNNKDDSSGPGETDLVMRDGFPALRIPGTPFQPMVDGIEPIPRHSFWASESVLTFPPDSLELFRQDCETVFTARDKPDGQAYSTRQDKRFFFLPKKILDVPWKLSSRRFLKNMWNI